MADKNEAIIAYLRQCPQLSNNALFFNFIEAKDNNKQLVTMTNDKAVDRPYVDGTVLKRYSFTIIDYRSVSYQAVVNITGHSNENVEELLDIQSIIDWIEEQNDIRNFPNFGNTCIIDRIYTATDNPALNGVDTSLKPALAKYSITIQVDYLDTSKQIWNN